jgi:hypothetical protein
VDRLEGGEAGAAASGRHGSTEKDGKHDTARDEDVPGIRRHRRRADERLSAGLGKARRKDCPEREAQCGCDNAERHGLQCEHDSDLAGGEADRLQQSDLTVLFAGARADEDSDDDEGDDQEQDGEDGDDHLRALCVAQRVVALRLPGLEIEVPGPRGRREGCCRARSEGRRRGRIRKAHRL